jgi:protein-S-isoprenylcysteine O-methyltransferase Ste14
MAAFGASFIAHEEAYLEREVGDDYCHFRTTARRWL